MDDFEQVLQCKECTLDTTHAYPRCISSVITSITPLVWNKTYAYRSYFQYLVMGELPLWIVIVMVMSINYYEYHIHIKY